MFMVVIVFLLPFYFCWVSHAVLEVDCLDISFILITAICFRDSFWAWLSLRLARYNSLPVIGSLPIIGCTL